MVRERDGKGRTYRGHEDWTAILPRTEPPDVLNLAHDYTKG